MLDKINEAKNIATLLSQLEERKNVLSMPVLFDLSILESIYEIFKEIESQKACPPNINTANERQKFCCIALRLYSPSVFLFEDRMIKGLRSALSSLLNVNSKTLISDYCKKVVFLYKQYQSYRNDMDYLYNKVTAKLKEKELI